MCAAPSTVSLPQPTRRPGVGGVLATGLALGGAAVTLAVVDPTEAGWLPACPFHAVTGWWCPGCGLTRATHHLLRGDVGAALAHHAFVPLVLAAIVVGWWTTLQAALGRPPAAWLQRVPRTVWVGLGVAIALYSVARNLAPFEAWGP